jgi:hypothetical protein
MDLVRMILIRMERSPYGWAPQDQEILGYSLNEIAYHAHIMKQEGLIEGAEITTMHSVVPDAMRTSLTWKGHEFLDLARDQERWNRAKAIIAKLGSAPISVWMKVLSDLLWKSVETIAGNPG